MVTLDGVAKSYGGRCVLNIAHFRFEPGRRYAVIGPNGCGKTTLLRVMCGALLPDEGRVQMPEEWRESFGYMPQTPYAFGFSVLKNVSMALPKSSPNVEDKARQALFAVGLSCFLKQRGGSLSGGEAQRMALARMLVRPRPLLVLDEPTSATDIAGNDLVERALLEYCGETGCTLIFSTHAPAQAHALAETVLVLDDGEIVESGEVKRVLHSPENERTAAFLGHWRI